LKPSFIGLFDFLRMIGLVGSHLSISPSDFLVRWFPPKTRAAAAGHPRPQDTINEAIDVSPADVPVKINVNSI